LPIREVRELNRGWRYWARFDQLPPDGAVFRNWLVLGGRGAGKTRAGAEWVRGLALGLFDPPFRRCQRIAIVAPTFAEARLVMIEGASGLLSVHHADERPHYEPSKRTITWPNGSVAQIFSAEDPEGLRGPQFDAAWCDELAKWKRGQEVWENLQFGLRIGDVPHAVITTTPRPTKLVRELIIDSATVVTRARTIDNWRNLAPRFLDDVLQRFGGTRFGRQELDGELISDDPDALFGRDLLEQYRVKQAPELKRIVVAVDPPASIGEKASACGIVCVGLGRDDRCYVLADRSAKRLRPAQWARRVIDLAETWNADRIVTEVNQGGNMVEAVLREVDPNAALKAVRATTNKRARAEPVAALYEQGRVSHVRAFPDLEDEMCRVIEEGESPDRLDALVWAVTELMLRKRAEPKVRGL
jgi:phage terminase large subunit-like protein